MVYTWLLSSTWDKAWLFFGIKTNDWDHRMVCMVVFFLWGWDCQSTSELEPSIFVQCSRADFGVRCPHPFIWKSDSHRDGRRFRNWSHVHRGNWGFCPGAELSRSLLAQHSFSIPSTARLLIPTSCAQLAMFQP